MSTEPQQNNSTANGSAPPPATKRVGDYILYKSLGQCVLWENFLAKNVSTGGRCIVKVFSDKVSRDASLVSELCSLGQKQAILSNPNIVHVEGIERCDDSCICVTAFVPGPQGNMLSAADYLRLIPRKRTSEKRTKKWAKQIASALCEVHTQWIIHGTLRSDNVLIDAGGNVMLADVGLARVAGLDDELSGVETAEFFTSPEIWDEEGEPDHRSDIYSLGVLIFNLLTGQFPEEQFRPPSQIVPGLAPQWDNIVSTCLAIEPGNRYPSTDQLLAEIGKVSKRKLAQSAPVAAATPPPEAIPIEEESGQKQVGVLPDEEHDDGKEDVSFKRAESDLGSPPRRERRKYSRNLPNTSASDTMDEVPDYLTGLTAMADSNDPFDEYDENADEYADEYAPAEPKIDENPLTAAAAAAGGQAQSTQRRIFRLGRKGNNSDTKLIAIGMAVLFILLIILVAYLASDGKSKHELYERPLKDGEHYKQERGRTIFDR